MGIFLRQLRKEKGISLEKLSKEFDKTFLDGSTNAISSWEKGKTIPDIDKLNFLSSFYNLTIDEILNGERIPDFNQKYFVTNGKWDNECNPNELADTYDKQCILIVKTCNTLIKKFLCNNTNTVEEKELIFLLSNFYLLNGKPAFFETMKLMSNLKNSDMNIDEKYWEIKKRIELIPELRLEFSQLYNNQYRNELRAGRFKLLDDWEKDLLLSCLQVHDASLDYAFFGKQFLKMYKESNHEDFDMEKNTKDMILFFVQNGSLLNSSFMGHMHGRTQHVRIIDGIETIINKISKPFEVITGDNSLYSVENTANNRLVKQYYYELVKPLLQLGYSVNEIRLLIVSNRTIPDELLIKLAKQEGINIGCDIEEIRENARIPLALLEKAWREFHDSECLSLPDEVYVSQSDLNSLKNGEPKEHDNIVFDEWVGGRSYNSRYEYVLSKIRNMSYNEYLLSRDKDRTNTMIEDLSSLNVENIRNKYFI